MPAKHLCIVTSGHPIDDVRVHTKIADSFLNAGWQVSWVGPEVAVHEASSARDPRISYFFSRQVKGRFGRLIAGFLLSPAAKPVSGVDWWYSPDPDAARVAARLARRKGGRSMIDIHEVYHEGHLARWTFGRQIEWIGVLVRARIRSTCKRVDLAIGVGEGVTTPYTVGLRTPTLVVRSCAPASFAQAAPSIERSRDETFVMHGKAAYGNGTPMVLEALRSQVHTTSTIRILMFHDPARPVFQPENFELPAENLIITTVAPVPHRDVATITSSCDAGMISYGRDLGVDSMPNRLFEYMAAGIAIFAPSYSLELKRILDEEQIGITADFESPKEIGEGLSWIAEHPKEVREMGQRARIAFLARHCWEREFETLLDKLDEVKGAS